MEIVQEVGTAAGVAAVVGLAALSTLHVSQARDIERLCEWAGLAPEPRRANLGDVQFDVALPTWLDDYHLAETDGSTCPFTPTISALGNFESAES